MKTIAMIPARMGSQRLKKKNLRELKGVPLITRAIRKCIAANCFDEIYVNSEDEAFRAIAEAEGVQFYQRPNILGDNNATSEDYITDFLRGHDCDHILQVHSIAPLLSVDEVRRFTEEFIKSGDDVYLSCIEDQIEVAIEGKPVNFTFDEKTNSQELIPTQRVTWSITGWRRETFMKAKDNQQTATYAGTIGFFAVSAFSGHVIKTEADLNIAEALLDTM